MRLYYDQRDRVVHESRGSHIIDWLDELGAKPVQNADASEHGFLIASARPLDDYARLVANLPLVRDRPAERAPLLRLDSVLDALDAAGVDVPTPKTWRLPLDAAVPDDIEFPLFVRTAHSSLKLGGRISRVTNREELESEAAELRRLLGWDALILAREWHDLAQAGEGIYGPIPQELRVWVVDGNPVAWSFHYLGALANPKGFPPPLTDLRILGEMAGRVARAFRSRCVAADFARAVKSGWLLIEAGPGSCAATAHECAFKSVASALCGKRVEEFADKVGGTLL